MIKALLFVVALLSGMASHAAPEVRYDPAFQGFKAAIAGNRTTISFAGDGTPLSSSRPVSGSVPVGNLGVERRNGRLFLSSTGSIIVPGTNTTVPVQGRVNLSARAVARGFVRALGVYALWQTGSELWNIWASNGLHIDPATGSVTAPSTSQGLPYFVESPIRQWGHESTNNLSDSALRSCQISSANATLRFGHPLLICSTVLSVGPFPYEVTRFQMLNPDGTPHHVRNITRGGPIIGCRVGVLEGTNCVVRDVTRIAQTPTQVEDRLAANNRTDTQAATALSQALAIPQIASSLIPELKAEPLALEFPGGAQSIALADPEVRTQVEALPDARSRTTTTTTTRVAQIEPATATQTQPAVRWDQSIVTRVVYKDATGAVTSDLVTHIGSAQPLPQSQPEPNTQPQSIITCGLPGKPPCVISELGVPPPVRTDVSEEVASLMSPITACVADLAACLPDLPDVSFTIELPTTCDLIPVPGFEAFLDPIDICKHQPIFHQIMTVLWAAAGIFGAMSIVSRSSTT